MQPTSVLPHPDMTDTHLSAYSGLHNHSHILPWHTHVYAPMVMNVQRRRGSRVIVCESINHKTDKQKMLARLQLNPKNLGITSIGVV